MMMMRDWWKRRKLARFRFEYSRNLPPFSDAWYEYINALQAGTVDALIERKMTEHANPDR